MDTLYSAEAGKKMGESVGVLQRAVNAGIPKESRKI